MDSPFLLHASFPFICFRLRSFWFLCTKHPLHSPVSYFRWYPTWVYHLCDPLESLPPVPLLLISLHVTLLCFVHYATHPSHPRSMVFFLASSCQTILLDLHLLPFILVPLLCVRLMHDDKLHFVSDRPCSYLRMYPCPYDFNLLS